MPDAVDSDLTLSGRRAALKKAPNALEEFATYIAALEFRPNFSTGSTQVDEIVFDAVQTDSQKSPLSHTGDGLMLDIESDSESEESEYEDEDSEDEQLTFASLDKMTFEELLRLIFDGFSSSCCGVRLMNGPDWRLFLADWYSVTKKPLCMAHVERMFAEELQLQRDMCYRFDLSPSTAGRGLCFGSFQVLVGKALPRGLAQRYAAVKYLQFSGEARRRARR